MSYLQKCRCARLSYAATVMLWVFAMPMSACNSDDPEPIAATSSPGADELRSVDRAVDPNSAFLEWDAVSYPSLRGYRVYYGPDQGSYLQLRGRGIDVGDVTAYTVTGLISGRRYYFAVTAYDSSNNESEYSNEVFKDIS